MSIPPSVLVALASSAGISIAGEVAGEPPRAVAGDTAVWLAGDDKLSLGVAILWAHKQGLSKLALFAEPEASGYLGYRAGLLGEVKECRVYEYSNGNVLEVSGGDCQATTPIQDAPSEFGIELATELGCQLTADFDYFSIQYMGLEVGRISNSSKPMLVVGVGEACLLYTSPSPRDATLSRMPSSA